MGQALYRKYRSKKLSEIVGQEHIIRTLTAALKSGRISHAYLFTGPRGVGKTSVARILAHEINDVPYDSEQLHIDIIEIDAASNRRIDEIRDLRDKVRVAPVLAKYKVYIIDEVHMLTREAFNALLKTLEEPPAHVIFILATTEAHKLPETIVSRTQRFVFRPIEPAKVVAHLKDIAKHENITISDDALQLIAEHGDGSFRDSISLLDQASGQGGPIDVATIQALLGMPPQQAIEDLLAHIEQGNDLAGTMALLNGLYDQGFQAAAIAKLLATQLRSQLVSGTYGGEVAAATSLLANLLEVAVSHDPERFLEIVILRSLKHIPATTSDTPQPAPPAQTPTDKPAGVKAADVPKAKTAVETAPEPAPAKTKTAKAPTAAVAFDEASWAQVLASLKMQYNTLYSIARMAQPRMTADGSLELVFAFAFHQKRLNETKNRKIVSDAIAEITGQQIDIICSLDPDLKLSKTAPATSMPAEDHSLSTISNIFGGGEVLQ